MTVEFVCEQCDKDNLVALSNDLSQIDCQHCGNPTRVKLSKGMQSGGKVDRCVLCDKNRFYVQKDFNPRLGILIFAIGVIFSYHTYFISLAVATLIDFILYKVLKTVTICYSCRAVYRGFEEDPTHRGFDHNIAMSLVVKEEKKQAVVQPSH
ncbi:MAG: hypothetical protein ACE5G1_14070 [bacterium]